LQTPKLLLFIGNCIFYLLQIGVNKYLSGLLFYRVPVDYG